MTIALLDVDGTLIDTNYHHAIAWFRALRRFELVVPIWRIHRHIGMGGDQLVTAVCGEQVEQEHGAEIRSAEGEEYERLIGEVQPVERARELVLALNERGHRVVLSSSAKEDEVQHYLDLLGAREIVHAWTTSDDVQATKPEPDLVRAGLERAGDTEGEAVMVGDTPWDVKAAEGAGVPTIAVVTGGFSTQELTDAGAAAVFESVAELERRLDETTLA
jgi:HAD superfamily hydrolase (TIGR01509 family)